MRNGVQLITYADRLGGGDLDDLRRLLTGPFAGTFTGVHILPFFTPYDGADAGFDAIDHTEVDPRLGSWDAIAAIASTHDLTADLTVNHVSAESPQFPDFRARGDESARAGMFLSRGSVFPAGASDGELGAIYRPRPGLPFTEVRLADGSTREMWTTFTPQQIDLNMADPAARAYLASVLDRFAAVGVAQVRLDAVGYAIKTVGTSSFMTPETSAFIQEIGDEVRSRGMEALLEVHSYYRRQLELAPQVDRIYDFALPPLVLHTLYTGSADVLRHWLAERPTNAITVLDTHDGIGVVDAAPQGDEPGLLSSAEIDALVERIHDSTSGESRMATGEAASNLDLYQVNTTFYSALARNDDAFLLARLIQFLTPGIPQVYYAGLLAAVNDMELLAKTGNGRAINRPYYSGADIESQLERPVVQRLLSLIAWRNTHPAFAGEFTTGGDGSLLEMHWQSDGGTLDVSIDVASTSFSVACTRGDHACTIERWDEF